MYNPLDPRGQEALNRAAADIKRYAPPPTVRLRDRLAFKVVAAAAVAVPVGLVAAALQEEPETPERAVVRVVEEFDSGDYARFHSSLCSADRQRFTVADVERGARVVNLALRGVDGFRTLSTTEVPAREGAVVVSGSLLVSLGSPVPTSLVVLNEDGRWRPCASAGGFTLSAPGLMVDWTRGIPTTIRR